MALDLNDPKNLEKFMASGNKTSYADWAKQQDVEAANVTAQNKANAGNIAETNTNFNYDTQIKPVTETAGTSNQVNAAVIPQAQVKLPKLTDTQVKQLDNLANIRTELTNTDVTNLKTAINQGYVIPENLKNLAIKQGLAGEFGITLPTTGKVDLNLPETTGAIDAATVKSDNIKPEDLLGTTTPKVTAMETPQAINSMLSTGQQELDKLFKQQEETALRLKDLQQAESDRLAKGLEAAGTTSLEAKTSEYYNKYDVDSKYNAASDILKQIANVRSQYAGATGTGNLTREGLAKISQLQSEYALLNGNFTQAKEMANTFIDAVKTDLSNKVDTYKTLLNRSDSKLVSLTKDQKDIVNNRIALYQDAIKKQDEKKATIDKVLTDNSGYTLTRARQIYGLDTAKDDQQTIQDKVAKAKQDQSFIDALAAKYLDAGITATDTIQSATNKMKSSQIYKNELIKGAGSDSAVMSRAMNLLNTGKASNIYEALDMANTEIAEEESGRTISENIAKQEAKTGTTEQQKIDAENTKNSAITLIDEIRNDKALSLATGLSSFTTQIPGTDAYNIAKKVAALKDTLAMANLSKLKGAMSDKDLEFLRNTATSLDVGLKTEDFIKELDKIRESLGKVNTANIQAPVINTKEDLIKYSPENTDLINKMIEGGEDIQTIKDYLGFKTEGSDSKNATKALSFNTNGLQCGEFVNKTAGIRVGNTWTEKANNVSKYGYKGSSGLGVGDVIYQDTGTPYGHVAVVTAINPDGTATVSESNWNKDEKVTHGRKVKMDKIYGYIRPSEANKLAISQNTNA